MRKLFAIVFSLALLAWPGSFGSVAVSGEIPLVEEADVIDAGEFHVYIVTGVSAKRMYSKYGSMILVNEEDRLIVVLKLEA